MNLPAILLLTLSSILVLRTGERIDVAGAVREDGGRYVFRAANGTLYSIPVVEVDLEATRAVAAETDPEPDAKKLRVSAAERDRLLRELEKNHSGQPAQRSRILEEPPPAPAPHPEEWEWRRQARAYEEDVRRAREDLQMLHDRVERLQSEIRSFLNLGYSPRQFTYQTTQLHYTLEMIPSAELAVTRAERAWEQFREDARRQDIMPGWLR